MREIITNANYFRLVDSARIRKKTWRIKKKGGGEKGAKLWSLSNLQTPPAKNVAKYEPDPDLLIRQTRNSWILKWKKENNRKSYLRRSFVTLSWTLMANFWKWRKRVVRMSRKFCTQLYEYTKYKRPIRIRTAINDNNYGIYRPFVLKFNRRV